MNLICPNCKIPLSIGKILSGSYDVHGERSIMQYNPPPSNGKLEDCYKCEHCGYSEIWIKPLIPCNNINVKFEGITDQLPLL